MAIGKIIPLPADTKAQLGYDFIVRLTYADIIQLTSGTAQAVIPLNAVGATTYTIPAGSVVEKIVPNVTTAFAYSGADNGTLVYTLGDGGSANRFVASVTLKTAGFGVAYTSKYCYTAADTIDIVCTAATQAITALVAGQVDFYVKLADLSTLANVATPSAT